MLESFLLQIEDHRRKQGKRYQLGHILLFAILGIMSGATSYRKIQCFIAEHYEELDKLFDLQWKRLPAYTTIRAIIQGTSAAEMERCFRAYSRALQGEDAGRVIINCDGKTLRGSFDHFADSPALQLLSAYAANQQLILAHEEVATKTNEIPVVQHLIEQLGLSDAIFTLDALHCQKKRLRQPKQPVMM